MKQSKPTSKPIKITAIRMAVAKECVFYENSTKEFITSLTRAYLRQLKKDNFKIVSWRHNNSPSENLNATKVQFFIEKLRHEETLNPIDPSSRMR